ncbi:hypothetical protein VP01_8413g1 [Puccinia sorghi]|uniref:Uncharacterized protein n=1 Tax=Puccinia sorghi TaxID=27349 RepID=A0A0L6U9D0_9BASI|nr:hypothetical protein VP01_8413g1 [Puccinia sorghi]
MAFYCNCTKNNSKAKSAKSSDDDENEEDDILLNAGKNGGFFTQEDITKSCQNMTGVVLPPELPKLPANLAEECHGKLKAAQWYCLFASVIPLVIFDLYLSDIQDISINSNRGKFFMNNAYMMQCTHILFARQINGAQINRFQSNYQKYCETVGKLFEGVKVQPNHHFSLHIPQQI